MAGRADACAAGSCTYRRAPATQRVASRPSLLEVAVLVDTKTGDFLLPQAGEGARRADEGTRAQVFALAARSSTQTEIAFSRAREKVPAGRMRERGLRSSRWPPDPQPRREIAFSRAREKVPEGRMRGRGLRSSRWPPDLQPRRGIAFSRKREKVPAGQMRERGLRVVALAARSSTQTGDCLLPQAGEGARRADEGTRAQVFALAARSSTQNRPPG